MKFGLPLHPESKKLLLKRSLRFYLYAIPHVFFLSLLLSVVIFIPRILMYVIGQDVFYNLPVLSKEQLWLLLIDVAALLFFTSLLWRLRCLFTDAHETIGDDMKIALKKIPYILVAVLIQVLLFLAINLFFVLILNFLFSSPTGFVFDEKLRWVFLFLIFTQSIIIVYLSFAFYFYLPIILIENKGIIPALMKSASLVWGNWWRTFWVQLTPWITYTLVLTIIRFITPLPIHIYFVQTPYPPSLLAIILHIIVLALFIPWIGSLLLLQLHDLELRKKLKPVKTEQPSVIA